MAKKRVVRKTTSRRAAVKNKRKPVFEWRRIIIWGSLPAFVLAYVLLSNTSTLSQSVAGVSTINKSMFNQGQVNWQGVDKASSYNIYYKKSTEKNYSNAVRNIPANLTHYTISYLKKNTSYVYKIAAVDSKGAEFWWSADLTLSNISSM